MNLPGIILVVFLEAVSPLVLGMALFCTQRLEVVCLYRWHCHRVGSRCSGHKRLLFLVPGIVWHCEYNVGPCWQVKPLLHHRDAGGNLDLVVDQGGIPAHLSAGFDQRRSPIRDVIGLHRRGSVLHDFRHGSWCRKRILVRRGISIWKTNCCSSAQQGRSSWRLPQPWFRTRTGSGIGLFLLCRSGNTHWIRHKSSLRPKAWSRAHRLGNLIPLCHRPRHLADMGHVTG